MKWHSQHASTWINDTHSILDFVSVHCQLKVLYFIQRGPLTDDVGNLQLAPPAEWVRVTVGVSCGDDGEVRPVDFRDLSEEPLHSRILLSISIIQQLTKSSLTMTAL